MGVPRLVPAQKSEAIVLLLITACPVFYPFVSQTLGKKQSCIWINRCPRQRGAKSREWRAEQEQLQARRTGLPAVFGPERLGNSEGRTQK